MKTRTYQIALVVVVFVCIALTAALVYVVHPQIHWLSKTAPQDTVVARGSAADTGNSTHDSTGSSDGETALTSLQLSPQRLQEIGVTTAKVMIKDVSDTLNVPGNVDIDEGRVSYVQIRFPGWIQDVSVNATYQYVHKGQRLFTIYSPDIVSSEQEYLLARKNETSFEQDAHGMAAQESGWLLKAAEEHLQQYGIPAQVVADMEQSGKVLRNIPIDSPAAGYITERNALPNAYVQPETKLYTIADLSTVWVYANVFQNDVGRLKPGDQAQVTVDAYPGRIFNGRIDQILPQVDLTTRTVRVRLVLRNPSGLLKPGMYVNAAIAEQLGRQLVIPASALLQAGTRGIVFVNHGNGNLEPRVIEAGPQLKDSVVILSGLKAGDEVVSSANFLVDSEAQLQSAFGASTPPPAQQGANESATQVVQAHIEMTTEPSPPRKGANTIRVMVTGLDGKPMSGTQVTVNFFMAAMPAMGMAAEHVTANMVEKGNGTYEGSIQLETGGTYQVSIVVLRSGQTVGTKQLSLTATGGM